MEYKQFCQTGVTYNFKEFVVAWMVNEIVDAWLTVLHN